VPGEEAGHRLIDVLDHVDLEVFHSKGAIDLLEERCVARCNLGGFLPIEGRGVTLHERLLFHVGWPGHICLGEIEEPKPVLLIPDNAAVVTEVRIIGRRLVPPEDPERHPEYSGNPCQAGDDPQPAPEAPHTRPVPHRASSS